MGMSDSKVAEDILISLRQIIRAFDLQSKKLSKKFGLTGPQLMVLKEIKKYPSAPISSISKNISLSQATVTSILDRLEQQGFACRKRSEDDKRKVYICLTPKADQILESDPTILQEDFMKNLHSLPDWEKHMLIASLQKLSSMMGNTDILDDPLI